MPGTNHCSQQAERASADHWAEGKRPRFMSTAHETYTGNTPGIVSWRKGNSATQDSTRTLLKATIKNKRSSYLPNTQKQTQRVRQNEETEKSVPNGRT